MHYVLIKGPCYGDRDFEAREQVRDHIRQRLENHGIRFVEYNWVWDEQDRCLLVTGTYEHPDDSREWIAALKSMGFDICIRTRLPGDDH